MNERNILIVRAGEASLKGENKPYFERMLADRIKKLLKRFNGVEVEKKEGLIFIRSEKSIPQKDILHEVKKVFGISSVSPAMECAPNIEAIEKTAVEYMNSIIAEKNIKTFKGIKESRQKFFFDISSNIKDGRFCCFERMQGAESRCS